MDRFSGDMFADGWTLDAQGHRIDWTRPPHYRNGVLNLVLPGEDIVSPDVLGKRRAEYMKLTRDRLKRRNKNAPTV